jgi:hypothetical protein
MKVYFAPFLLQSLGNSLLLGRVKLEVRHKPPN